MMMYHATGENVLSSAIKTSGARENRKSDECGWTIKRVTLLGLQLLQVVMVTTNE